MVSREPGRRQLIGTALRYVGKAALIGVLAWVPIATIAWWTGRPGPQDTQKHTEEFTFAAMPTDLAPLRDWATGQPGVQDVMVRRVEKAGKGEVVELRYGSQSKEHLAPPWQELGYLRPDSTTRRWVGKLRIGVHQGLSYYLFLLARCLDVGFLIVGILWLRRARRAGRPLPRLFRGAARRAAVWGLVAGLVLAGLVWLYSLVPLAAGKGIAGAWPMTVFWPAWARIVSLSLVPLVFPLCQELFFRGALFGSFQGAGRPWTGVLVSALLFTVVQLDLRAAPAFLVIGVVQAWLYKRTESLLAPLIAGFVCAALAITLPSFLLGTEFLHELTRGMLEAIQDIGK
ncbi:MAG: lysostaphin resistance A-like protein [Planctomycetota bacterium]